MVVGAPLAEEMEVHDEFRSQFPLSFGAAETLVSKTIISGHDQLLRKADKPAIGPPRPPGATKIGPPKRPGPQKIEIVGPSGALQPVETAGCV